MFLIIFVFCAVIYGSDSLQDSYLIKKSTSCPAAGYFYEREISINSLGSKNCYICFCNNEIAFCWKHGSKRCKKQAMPKGKNSNQTNITHKENYRTRLKNNLDSKSKHIQKRKPAKQDIRKPKITRKRDDLPTASKMNGIADFYKYGRAFRRQRVVSSKRSSNRTNRFKPGKITYKNRKTKPKLNIEHNNKQVIRDDRDKMKQLNKRKQLTKSLLQKLTQAMLLLSDGNEADRVLTTKKTSRDTKTENEPDILEIYLKQVLDSINRTNNHKTESKIKKREALDFSMSRLEDLFRGASLFSRNSSTEKQLSTLQDYHTVFDSLSKNTKDSEYYKYTVEEGGKNKTPKNPDKNTDLLQRMVKQTIKPTHQEIRSAQKANSVEPYRDMSKFLRDNVNTNNDANIHRRSNYRRSGVVFRNKKQKPSSKLKRKRQHRMKHKIKNCANKNITNCNVNKKKCVNIKNRSNQNTLTFMKKLFKHHLLFDKEQNNMIKKINIMKTVCPAKNKCNISGVKKKKLRPKLKQLNDIPNKINDIIYNIKSQVKLLRNERNMTNPTEIKEELDTLDSILKGTFFANNSKNFTFNQKDKIAKIKNGAKIFVKSVKKFTSTLNYIITLASSSEDNVNLHNNVLKRMLRYAESDEKKYKEQIESTLKKLRTLFRKHNNIHNRLHRGFNKVVERNYNSKHKRKSYIFHAEFHKAKELKRNTPKIERFMKKMITNLKMFKDFTTKMDFHKMRMKRDTHMNMEYSDYYDYLLLMMELSLLQNNNLIVRNEPPPPQDGIDVLLDAIINSPYPTTAPIEKKSIEYRTKSLPTKYGLMEGVQDTVSRPLVRLSEVEEQKRQLRKLFTSIDYSTLNEDEDKGILNYEFSGNLFLLE